MSKKEKKRNKGYIYFLLIVIAIIICYLSIFNKPSKFYLSDKYYNNGEYITATSSDIELLNNDSYLLYTYNNFCNLPVHCKDVFESIMKKYKVDVISIPFGEFKNTGFYKKVEYAPSVLIIKDGKIVAYLDANKDRDLQKYQDEDEFEKWLSEYIYLTK